MKKYQPLTLEEFHTSKSSSKHKETDFVATSNLVTHQEESTLSNPIDQEDIPFSEDNSLIKEQQDEGLLSKAPSYGDRNNEIEKTEEEPLPPGEEYAPKGNIPSEGDNSLKGNIPSDGADIPEKESIPEEPEIPPAPTFSEEELAMAKAIAYQEGYDKALEESRHNHLTHLHESLDNLVQAINEHINKKNIHLETITIQASEIITELFNQMMPFFTANYGVKEITDAIDDILPTLMEEDSLTFTFSDVHRDILEEKIPQILKDHHFKGEYYINYEQLPDLYTQVKWRFGCITKDPNVIKEGIDRALETLKKHHKKALMEDNVSAEESVVVWENIKRHHHHDDEETPLHSPSPGTSDQIIETSSEALSDTSPEIFLNETPDETPNTASESLEDIEIPSSADLSPQEED